MKRSITVCVEGWLDRRWLRSELKNYGRGIEYIETKTGWSNSEFKIFGPERELRRIASAVRLIAGEIG